MNNSTHFKAEFSADSATSTRVLRELAIFVVTLLVSTFCWQQSVTLACWSCFDDDKIFVKSSLFVRQLGNARLLIVLRRRQDLREISLYLLVYPGPDRFVGSALTQAFADNNDSCQLLWNEYRSAGIRRPRCNLNNRPTSVIIPDPQQTLRSLWLLHWRLPCTWQILFSSPT